MTLQYGEETSSSAMDIENPLSPIGREIKRQPIVEGKEDIGKVQQSNREFLRFVLTYDLSLRQKIEVHL